MLGKSDSGFLIDGDLRQLKGSNGELQLYYAADGSPTRVVQMGGAEEMEHAVAAAQKAFKSWRRMAPGKRRVLFYNWAELIRKHGERISEMTVIECGIPIGVARGTIEAVADGLEYYGGWCDKLQGRLIPTWPTEAVNYSVPEPYGVVACFIPFNLPLYSVSMQLGPALATGNCVVAKPSSSAPFVMLFAGQLALEAGFPPGVLNMVPADAKAGEILVRTDGVNKVLFMGSTKSGRYVGRAAGETVKPIVQELGGKSPHLIFDDIDPKKSAHLAVGVGLGNMGGQGCALGTRLLVHSSIYDDFLQAAIESAQTLTPGDPLESDTLLGPMNAEMSAQRIMNIIDQAKATGDGRLITGGSRPGGKFAKGAYVEPTLFADVDNKGPLATQEIFGPVLTIAPFDTDEEAIVLANDHELGLSAYIQTKDSLRINRLTRDLEVGSVFVNYFSGPPVSVPFGGTKLSGYGRIGGQASIEEFTYHKNVSIAVEEQEGGGLTPH